MAPPPDANRSSAPNYGRAEDQYGVAPTYVNDGEQQAPPQVLLLRVGALLGGAIYIFAIGCLLAGATSASPIICVAGAYGGAALLVGILLLLGCCMYRDGKASRRFGLDTLLLTTAGLAILLAPLGIFYRAISPDLPAEGYHVNLLAVMYFLLFVPISAFVLVHFTDALLRLVLTIHEFIRTM